MWALDVAGAAEGAPLLPMGRFRCLRGLSLSGQLPSEEQLLNQLLRSLPPSLERLTCGLPAIVRVSNPRWNPRAQNPRVYWIPEPQIEPWHPEYVTAVSVMVKDEIQNPDL